ncbi:MAG: HAD-IC family P-type ATPase, partial [Clostridia bacterium]|nr:HAD-IC family P-type ATPase [Clostridia bacterium]
MSCKDNCCHCCEEAEHKHSHGHEHCADIDACGCGCGHEKSESKLPVVAVVCGALLTALSFLPFLNETVGKTMLIAAVIICGLPTFKSALLSLKNRKINESLLLLIAVVAAMILGEFTEAAAVSVFFRIGELLEEFASGRSRKSIESLYSIVSDEANLVNEDGTTVRIDADEVEIGNRLAVMPHEIICVDGVVYSGEGTVDASAITGESLPVEVRCGDKVRSGMKNGDSVIYIEATAVKNMSSAALIASLVENAAQEKGESQRAVTKFASYYTPAVVAVAFLVAVIPSLITGNWQEWIHRSLILLVASCP